MKKFIALLVITSILMVAILPAALAQQTVAPGGTVTVEIPFSGEGVRFVDLDYEKLLSAAPGLEFVEGKMKDGGFLGKAGSKRAIYLKNDLSEFNSGTLLLTVKAKADATGEQTLTIESVRGYKLGADMINMTGATKKVINITAASGLKGDATGDGKVNHEDVTAIILLITTGKPVTSQVNADATGDKLVDHRDLTAVILHITGAKKLH